MLDSPAPAPAPAPGLLPVQHPPPRPRQLRNPPQASLPSQVPQGTTRCRSWAPTLVPSVSGRQERWVVGTATRVTRGLTAGSCAGCFRKVPRTRWRRRRRCAAGSPWATGVWTRGWAAPWGRAERRSLSPSARHHCAAASAPLRHSLPDHAPPAASRHYVLSPPLSLLLPLPLAQRTPGGALCPGRRQGRHHSRYCHAPHAACSTQQQRRRRRR